MKRTVEVSTRGTQLSIKDARMVVQRDGDILGRIPMEDIGLVVLDSVGIMLSSGFLSALTDHGGAVLVCDGRHLPSGLYLPLAGNSLHAERVRFQANASEPLKKNLWAKMVRAKVLNQAALLEDQPSRQRLMELATKVRSGDSGNIEAQAARVYWPSLFAASLDRSKQPFRRRRNGGFPNSHLNYGYAVLRAATARALCGAGLHPGFGIHHHNRYSGYPLADDLMEPFRPWVDAAVLELLDQGEEGPLSRESKKRLLEVLVDKASMPSGDGPLLVALERGAASLAESFSVASKNTGAVEAAGFLQTPGWSAGEAA